MKVNKYIMKYTVPHKYGNNQIFVSFGEIITDDEILL